MDLTFTPQELKCQCLSRCYECIVTYTERGFVFFRSYFHTHTCTCFLLPLTAYLLQGAVHHTHIEFAHEPLEQSGLFPGCERVSPSCLSG